MPLLLISIVVTAIFGPFVDAQSGPMSLCSDSACDDCPNSVTTTGTGYPACVIYERDTVLGGTVDQYELLNGTNRQVFFDIAAQTDPTCKTIIRTPASTDDENCGAPIYGADDASCFKAEVKETFMVQFCCGPEDCTKAFKKRDGETYSIHSAVLSDAEGNILLPHAVGNTLENLMDVFVEDFGLNSSAIPRRSAGGIPIHRIGYPPTSDGLKKRGCDRNSGKYNTDEPNYTKTGDESMQISGYICGSTTETSITNENSISRTTTFSSSVGDPFGIAQISIGFESESSASQSHTYTFKPDEGQCGHVTFTPFFVCTKGIITGCEGGDYNGELCTAKRVTDNEIDGAYTFVQTG